MTKEETFETSLVKLENIIRELEKGEVPLDEMVTRYTEAMKHLNFCSTKLNEATKTVNNILSENGNLEEFKTEE